MARRCLLDNGRTIQWIQRKQVAKTLGRLPSRDARLRHCSSLSQFPIAGKQNLIFLPANYLTASYPRYNPFTEREMLTEQGVRECGCGARLRIPRFLLFFSLPSLGFYSGKQNYKTPPG
jgi:hypothetical protein